MKNLLLISLASDQTTGNDSRKIWSKLTIHGSDKKKLHQSYPLRVNKPSLNLISNFSNIVTDIKIKVIHYFFSE